MRNLCVVLFRRLGLIISIVFLFYTSQAWAEIQLRPSIDSLFTPNEQLLLDAGHVDLANLMKTVRLQNPYPSGSKASTLWDENIQFNVPILVFASQFLDQYCRKNGYTTLLFSTRGNSHWLHVFQTLFPSYRSISFDTSRAMYCHPSEEYLKYVRSVYTEGALILDDQGSGKTAKSFYEKYFSASPRILYLVSFSSNAPGILTGGLQLTYINEDNIGSLIGYTSSGPVRAPLEYDLSLVSPAFECMGLAIRLFSQCQFLEYDEATFIKLNSRLKPYHPVLTSYHRNSLARSSSFAVPKKNS